MSVTVVARRIGVDRGQDVISAAGAGGKHVVLDVNLHVTGSDGTGVNLLVFQSPLVDATGDLAEVVDAGVFLRGVARPNEVRNRNRREQTDDGNHDHDFHEREAGFA